MTSEPPPLTFNLHWSPENDKTSAPTFAKPTISLLASRTTALDAVALPPETPFKALTFSFAIDPARSLLVIALFKLNLP